MNEPVKITFRKNGKAHRGLRYLNGWLVACCSCPGSKNGSLVNGAQIICDGHERPGAVSTFAKESAGRSRRMLEPFQS